MSGEMLAVAGASGLVGASITRTALGNGYRVRGTLRDAGEADKTAPLSALPGAKGRLELASADMARPGDFDAVVEGADCVFIASLIPTYVGASGTPAREMEDDQGYEEIVRPTLDGCMNILRSAASAGVRNVVICSSTSSTNPVPPVANKNEADHWSDEHQQYREKKYTSAAKTVMEKAAIRFAAENDIRLSILLPTLMLGPVVIPAQAERGFQGVIGGLVRGEPPRHEQVPNGSISMIHLDDVARLFLAAYENRRASGRYFAVFDSWHWQDIYDELARQLPDAPMPAPLEGEREAPTSFDFTRRDSLGVPLRDVPTIFEDTIRWHRENQ